MLSQVANLTTARKRGRTVKIKNRKPERKILRITCPACRKEVDAVIVDGIIKGECYNTGKQVLIKVD